MFRVQFSDEEPPRWFNGKISGFHPPAPGSTPGRGITAFVEPSEVIQV
jgi:hypothetical protein